MSRTSPHHRYVHRPLRPLIAALVLGASVHGASAQVLDPTPPRQALIGSTLVDVATGKEIPDAVVVLEGDRIIAAGPASSVRIPADATKIDLHGKWLMPGLLDTHVHLSLKLPGAAGAALVEETDAEQVLRMQANAYRSLKSGVTTLRLTGEYNGNEFALMKAIDGGEVVGPRIRSAGEIIVPTGGHGFDEVDGPAGFAKAVRTQIKRGATWIKLAISGGIADWHGEIAAAPMTDEELEMAIEVAHRNGVKVTAHNGSPEAARQALKAGIDGFEHGYFFTDDVLKEMARKQVWLVPTLVVTQPGAEEFYKKIGSPPWYLERVKSAGNRHWAMFQKAVSDGVPIALGTDEFPYEPNSGTTATIHEAELYVKGGMTTLQALQAATINAARMIDMDKQVATIQPGYYADMLALNADPMQDISALRGICLVMKGGQTIRNACRAP